MQYTENKGNNILNICGRCIKDIVKNSDLGYDIVKYFLEITGQPVLINFLLIH